MKCIVCGHDKFELIHHGTRDRKDVDVLCCMCCGGSQLSTFEQLEEGFYENSGMYQNTSISKMSSESVAIDDLRRAKMFVQNYEDKSLLDFGCGQGGFLRLTQHYTKKAVGVELEIAARERLQKEGIRVEDDIKKYQGKFDVITMFHVIEHLMNPLELLQVISERLTEDGELIIETPNADDALIKKYHCEAFKDFTYWSCHVFLYTMNSLETLIRKAGLRIKWSRQIQRFPITNHMYWLTEGKPGGHKIWADMNSDILNSEYERILKKEEMCDTLLVCVTKK